jgi:hypothetical protein
MLQNMQTSSILSRAVAAGLATFQFHPFKTHPPAIVDLLQAISCEDF